MRCFQSTETAKSLIIAAVTVVKSHMIVSALVVGFNFEFVKHLPKEKRQKQ